MYVFRTDDKILKLLYHKDTVNCDEQQFKKYPNSKIIEQWTKDLSENDQDQIIDFINDVVDRSFKDEGHSHAGDHYMVTRNRSNYLTIRYSNYHTDWTGFKDLKKKLTTANGAFAVSGADDGTSTAITFYYLWCLATGECI
ncbi:MAG: hypothetical protein IPJ86_05625 [Bacteroidetes bacterium]|nr:hypothetical protein [Bacteroidota bacterium]